MTVEQAIKRWVAEFSAFPYSMINKLVKMDGAAWYEVTVPTIGNRVMIIIGESGVKKRGD